MRRKARAARERLEAARRERQAERILRVKYFQAKREIEEQVRIQGVRSCRLCCSCRCRCRCRSCVIPLSHWQPPAPITSPFLL